MIPAIKPENEKERLKALRGFEVLDTPAEEAFDDLTRLASDICETPIALVSLVDSDRQWFKSRVGLDATETPRDLAFCAHAILEEEIFEVADATQDERFSDNPLVTEAPDIRFYAGAPLTTAKGLNLGTLCVIDRKPKKLNELQKNTLDVLSKQVIAQLELRLVARRALDLSQAKSRFLASMSHELRTPMNAILGFSALLKKKEFDPRSDDFINRIHSSGLRLLGLINDVLDLSKVEAGKINLRKAPVDVGELGRDLVAELEGLAGENVSLRTECVEGLGPLETDPDRLRQILLNLVGNALKFTKEGEVLVRITGQGPGPPRMIQVIDTGIGMDSDRLETIFRPFEQAHETTQQDFGGTGLGLALVKQLAKELGFRVSVTSEKGAGSVFSLVL